MLMIFSYPSLKSITKMNFIFLILGVHVLIKAELVFIIKLICCDECNHFHFLFFHGWSFAFNKILKLYDFYFHHTVFIFQPCCLPARKFVFPCCKFVFSYRKFVFSFLYVGGRRGCDRMVVDL